MGKLDSRAGLGCLALGLNKILVAEVLLAALVHLPTCTIYPEADFFAMAGKPLIPVCVPSPRADRLKKIPPSPLLLGLFDTFVFLGGKEGGSLQEQAQKVLCVPKHVSTVKP